MGKINSAAKIRKVRLLFRGVGLMGFLIREFSSTYPSAVCILKKTKTKNQIDKREKKNKNKKDSFLSLIRFTSKIYSSFFVFIKKQKAQKHHLCLNNIYLNVLFFHIFSRLNKYITNLLVVN